MFALIVGLIVGSLAKTTTNDNTTNDNKELHFLKYSNGNFVLDSYGNKIPSDAKNEALTKKVYVSPYQKKLIQQNNKTLKKANRCGGRTKSGKNNNCQIRKKNGRFG